MEKQLLLEAPKARKLMGGEVVENEAPSQTTMAYERGDGTFAKWPVVEFSMKWEMRLDYSVALGVPPYLFTVTL